VAAEHGTRCKKIGALANINCVVREKSIFYIQVSEANGHGHGLSD
jgi:hypothetical protein